MQRRILAAVAAFVLAAVGALLLINYVGSADDRARASEETERVLVALRAIDPSTLANELELGVDVDWADVPSRLVATDAITSLGELGSQPTTAELLKGEQLRAARFKASSGTGSGDEDRNLDKVSLTLDLQRAAGGNLSEGDRVAIYRTRTADGLSTSERLYNGVKVTRVSTVDTSGAMGGAVTVTLALSADQAKDVIAGMYDNAVWLSQVDATTTSGDDK